MYFFKKISLGVALVGILTSLVLTPASFIQAQDIEQTSKSEMTYSVREGDSLLQISETYDRDIDYLLALNNLDKDTPLAIGQLLNLGDGETLENGQVYVRFFPAYVLGLANFKYVAPVSQMSTANSQVQLVSAPAASVVQSGSGTSLVLANGNTAGEIGSYAAQQMEAATGVSASTWEYIIARESNGQVDAYNPSGASGLFQTMPGWGSTATVDDQIQAAINAYNAQGLSAWGQ